MKFYQRLLRFSFALLRKSFTFPLRCKFIPLFVIIKLKFRTNVIDTSVCALVDKDMSLSKNEKLSLVTMRSKLLWTICKYLRFDSVHSFVMVTSLWTIHNVCLSQPENIFSSYSSDSTIEGNVKIFFSKYHLNQV